jgi:uncharacterized membrane protein (UPF0127 family)
MKKLLLSTFSLLALSTQANAIVCNSVKFFDAETKSLKAQFQVSIADTNETRAKGLMFVKSMPEDVGMLFVWKQKAYRAMWMKNTYIPLDMIFIDDNNVVGVKANTVPHSIQSVYVEQPINQILEINAKQAEKYNIKAGDTMLCQP